MRQSLVAEALEWQHPLLHPVQPFVQLLKPVLHPLFVLVHVLLLDPRQ